MRIIPFEPRHADAWRTLNEAWIGEHFVIEPKDRQVLDDPAGQILVKGGAIFMVEDAAGAAIGCCALIAMADGGFELAKMTVAPAARGSGLGRALLSACIEAGRAAGAPRLYLETNSSLGPALALYRAMGFRDLPAAPTPYARCNVWMELRLDQASGP